MFEEKSDFLMSITVYLGSKKIRFCSLAVFLIICLYFTGCRPLYIFHVASGQINLINNSIPIDHALNGDKLSSEEKERLKLLGEIKKYGEQALGLRVTDNYQTVYLESRQPPIYVISASPKDQLTSITWWFPIVGRIPYLGFFDLDKAQKRRDVLSHKDLDVIISTADAYSTLGWFDDPVTLNLLDGNQVDLAEIILHEMTHTTLYLKGQSEFNEGMANLIGKKGTIAFMEQRYGKDHPLTIEAKNNLQDNRVFASFLSSLLDDLERCYGSPTTYEQKLYEREIIFKNALVEFKEIECLLKTDRYTYFGRYKMNNAYLLSIGLYNRYLSMFEHILEKNNDSIKKTIEFFRDLSKENEDMIETLKKIHQNPNDSVTLMKLNSYSNIGF